MAAIARDTTARSGPARSAADCRSIRISIGIWKLSEGARHTGAPYRRVFEVRSLQLGRQNYRYEGRPEERWERSRGRTEAGANRGDSSNVRSSRSHGHRSWVTGAAMLSETNGKARSIPPAGSDPVVEPELFALNVRRRIDRPCPLRTSERSRASHRFHPSRRHWNNRSKNVVSRRFEPALAALAALAGVGGRFSIVLTARAAGGFGQEVGADVAARDDHRDAVAFEERAVPQDRGDAGGSRRLGDDAGGP